MIPWPVSQHALHDRRLRLRDRQLDHASLFPFFDGQGEVTSLMLTTRESATIAFVDWKPALMRRLPFLAPQLDLTSGGYVSDVNNETAEHLVRQWHFDPWWELDGFRYAGHSAVPRLKGTNLPGFDASIKRIWFDADLKRVVLVALAEGDGVGLKRFTPELLKPALAAREARESRESTPEDSRSDWTLRPFWHQRGKT